MKVALAAKSTYPFHPVGGVQKYVYYFAKHLAQRGIDVEIVTPVDTGKPRNEIFDGIRYTLLAPSIYSYLEYPIGWLGVHLFSKSLVQYARATQFDLLHSFDMVSYQYLKLKGRKPVVSQIFSDNYMCNPISLANPVNLVSLFGRKTENIKGKKITIPIPCDQNTKMRYFAQYWFKIKPIYDCMSQSDMSFLEEEVFRKEVVALFKLDERRTGVLPVGVPMHIPESNDSFRREELGLAKEDIVLLTVNRLAADKGIDKIVLALENIKKENARVKLVIVGQGYQEREIQKLITNRGLQESVRHLKFVPEKKLSSLYRISDVYVSAFSFLGSSLSTLEAMVNGLPIVTTAQPWLVDGEQNGYSLSNNSPILIKNAVMSLIQKNTLKKQGEVSREIAKRYSWDLIAKSAHEQYLKILSN